MSGRVFCKDCANYICTRSLTLSPNDSVPTRLDAYCAAEGVEATFDWFGEVRPHPMVINKYNDCQFYKPREKEFKE